MNVRAPVEAVPTSINPAAISVVLSVFGSACRRPHCQNRHATPNRISTKKTTVAHSHFEVMTMCGACGSWVIQAYPVA